MGIKVTVSNSKTEAFDHPDILALLSNFYWKPGFTKCIIPEGLVMQFFYFFIYSDFKFDQYIVIKSYNFTFVQLLEKALGVNI